MRAAIGSLVFVVISAAILLTVNRCRRDAVGEGEPGETRSTAASHEKWGLRIDVLSVGHGDAVLITTPDGGSCLVDTGGSPRVGELVSELLASTATSRSEKPVSLDVLYSTHYDADHIGGVWGLVASGVHIGRAYDQGGSLDRRGAPVYSSYLAAVGDPDDNYVQGENEVRFARVRAMPGQVEKIGQSGHVRVRCLSVRGDTIGDDCDIPGLDPSVGKIDENAGSITLLVEFHAFAMYLGGDQTSNRWRASLPPVEEAIIAAGLPWLAEGVDVLKVSHHGSDTSTSPEFLRALHPQVAIISSDFHEGYRLPKVITLKTIAESGAWALVTGAASGFDGSFSDSPATTADDGYVVNPSLLVESCGNVTILVEQDGSGYEVRGAGFREWFSAH